MVSTLIPAKAVYESGLGRRALHLRELLKKLGKNFCVGCGANITKRKNPLRFFLLCMFVYQPCVE